MTSAFFLNRKELGCLPTDQYHVQQEEGQGVTEVILPASVRYIGELRSLKLKH